MWATNGSGDARGRVGLELESGTVGRSGATSTSGPRLSVDAGGKGRDGLGRRKGKGNGPAMGFRATGRKRKRREREKDWVGRA